MVRYYGEYMHTNDMPTLTVLMPCLNEERTIEACVLEAKKGIELAGVTGEVLVVDNGSSDRSIEIAKRAGARVVSEKQKGYGSALRSGIGHALGKYIVMGDADGSYDFLLLKNFLPPLRGGSELVMGNRFQGGIAPGAMPPLHHLGNPFLTFMLNVLFSMKIGDAHCGIRAFSTAAARSWDLRTLGMEFASEIVVKAKIHCAKITEIPFPLRKDGRDRPPHLRSFRDGWRHLRYLLLMSPSWVMALPACVSLIVGICTLSWLTIGPYVVGTVRFDIHMMIFGAMCITIGYQVLMLWAYTKMYGDRSSFLPRTKLSRTLNRILTLDRGLILGVAELVIGMGLGAYLLWYWYLQNFGELNVSITLRYAIWSLLLMVLGMQTIAGSFFMGFLLFQISPHDDMSQEEK